MSFKEKSTALTLIILTVVYGGYFWRLQERLLTESPATMAYQSELIGMVVLLIVLAIIGHIAITISAPREGDVSDERDRVIEQRGDQWAGYLLSGAALIAMALAMTEQAHFYIAHALLGGLVLAEAGKSVVMLVSYRRGY